MFRCRCCGRTRRREVASPYRTTQKCAYCAGFPYSEEGGCLGVHGEALRHHLDELVANGFWTRELAAWWLRRDEERLERATTPCLDEDV